MNKKKIGFLQLINIIGEDFFKKHEDSFLFSSQETEDGLWCFLGIDLHPETRELKLSATMEDWDVYASCYVKDDGTVVMDECKLP